MSYTLAAAAAATGLNKTTIFRAIRSGKISGTKDPHGQWLVEPAELHRVYPPDAGSHSRSDAPQRDAVADLELQVKALLAEQRLSDIKAALEDMRGQRDAWQAQAERLWKRLVSETPLWPFWPVRLAR